MAKTIVLCEAHIDSIARELGLDNLPFFISCGYDVFGFEHDYDKSLDFEIKALTDFLNFTKFFLSQTSHDPLYSYNLAQNNSNQKLLELFSAVKKQMESKKMEYRGLDIPLGNRWLLDTKALAEQTTPEKIQQRDEVIGGQLLKLPKNAIVIIGALHMKGVQQYLIDKMGKQAVLDHYTFIVPYAEVYPSEMDVRALMLNLFKEKKFEQLVREYCPLGSLFFFNKFPGEDEAHLSLNARFQQHVKRLAAITMNQTEEKNNLVNNKKKENISFAALTLVGATIGLFATGGVAGAIIGALGGASSTRTVATLKSFCKRF